MKVKKMNIRKRWAAVYTSSGAWQRSATSSSVNGSTGWLQLKAKIDKKQSVMDLTGQYIGKEYGRYIQKLSMKSNY